MEKTMKDLLIHSLDNELTPAQQVHLQKALAGSEALRQEQKQLLEMRSLLADLRVRRDLLFPERVMNRLEKRGKQGFLHDIVSLSPKVAAACIVFMLATTLGIYLREGSLSPEIVIGVEDLELDDAAIGVENPRLMRSSSDKALEGPERDKEK
jgi:hypothetical protein